MVDVNKILGIEEDLVQEIVKETSKNEFNLSKWNIIYNFLESIPETVEVAVSRKIDFSKTTLEGNVGLKMLFDYNLLSGKVKKINFQTVKKPFLKTINEYSMEDVFDFIENEDSIRRSSNIRLFEQDGNMLIGINTLKNTVFINWKKIDDSNDLESIKNIKCYLYLFNIIEELNETELNINKRNEIKERYALPEFQEIEEKKPILPDSIKNKSRSILGKFKSNS